MIGVEALTVDSTADGLQCRLPLYRIRQLLSVLGQEHKNL